MKALVIGGGIGGLTAAIALRRAGVDAAVYERAETLDRIRLGGAIHLWHNGMAALHRLDLAEDVEALGGRAAAVERAEFRTWRGALLAAWSVADVERETGAPTVGVVRPELHAVLTNALEADALRLGAACTEFEQDASGVTARFADGREERGDILVAADGLNSVVRRQLHGDTPARFAGYASWQALVEADDALAPIGLFRVLWGRGARFLFYRVDAARAYWEGIFATEAGGRDPDGGRKQAVLERFAGWCEPVEALVAATDEHAISRADVYVRPPLERWGERRATLLGDAAHPMTNAMGQGANQTIEDAVVLGTCLASNGDPEAALRAYEAKRIRRTTGIVRMSSRLSGASRFRRPWACGARDRMIKLVLGGAAAKRQKSVYQYQL